MARIQLVLPDSDRDRFVHEAKKENLSLSEWLRLAAKARVEAANDKSGFASPSELAAFFGACDEVEEDGPEPDWQEHLSVINQSKRRGSTET